MSGMKQIVFWQDENCPKPDLPSAYACFDMNSSTAIEDAKELASSQNCFQAIFFVSLENKRKLERAGFSTWLMGEMALSYHYQWLMMAAPDLLFSPNPALFPFQYVCDRPAILPAEFFIRPDAGDKTFSGQVLHPQDLSILKQTYPVPPDTLVIISETRSIICEWRYIIDIENQTIISARPYWHDFNIPLIQPIPLDFVSKSMRQLHRANAPEIIVLDFAVDEDNVPGILEINSISTSGLYGASTQDICHALSKLTYL